MASSVARGSLPIQFANAFLIAYGADATLSLIAFSGDVFEADSWFFGLQQIVARIVLLGTMLCLPMLAICARLPIGLFLTLCGSVLWLSSGGAPLALVFGFERELMPVLCALQMGFFVTSLLYIRFLNRGRSWLLSDATKPGPAVSLGHTLRFSAVLLFVITPLFAVYLMLYLATWLEVGTERFVQVDLSGIQLADRRYAQGDREIRLVGMMHVGEDATYRALTASFVSEDTIVLEEGVSDEDKLLEGTLSYEHLAHSLGLATQQSIGSYLSHESGDGGGLEWPVLRNADVDARVFSSETLEYLGLAAGVWDSDEPFAAFIELYEHLLEHPELSEGFLHDILELRNRHLLAEIETAVPQYRRVIVPWGALHLPDIERQLLDLGFVFVEETRRQVVGWDTLLTALLSPSVPS